MQVCVCLFHTGPEYRNAHVGSGTFKLGNFWSQACFLCMLPWFTVIDNYNFEAKPLQTLYFFST